MDLGLKNKVALVAGASKGLGKAVALGLAREGAHVAIISRDHARIEAAAQDIRNATGAQVLAITADVTRAEDIQRAVDETVKTFGTIHILVTNAGGPPPAAFMTLTDDQWQSAVNLTLMSAVRMSHAVVPLMQKQKWGRIIHLSSYSVKHPIENLMLSNSIRSAVVGLGKTQAMELARDGILVNNVLPGWTVTERVEQIMADRAERAKTDARVQYAAIEKEIPMGRMGKPEEFANVVVFLASECASYVNGVALPIDGGATRTAF
ncbi:3-oxoacyl-[acyl-carrier protein] reductase [Anaerolineae bacterium]|nr:3-oxoacyl-[acyl-carrier protein] reductase [Anaerolineae bacterium]